MTSNIKPLGQPEKPDQIQIMEQQMVDTAITNLLVAEGIMKIGEEGLSIKDQQKRVIDAGYEVIIRRKTDRETLYDKIHVKLVKTVNSSTVTFQAKKTIK